LLIGKFYKKMNRNYYALMWLRQARKQLLSTEKDSDIRERLVESLINDISNIHNENNNKIEFIKLREISILNNAKLERLNELYPHFKNSLKDLKIYFENPNENYNDNYKETTFNYNDICSDNNHFVSFVY
jgi:hypothetical protein